MHVLLQQHASYPKGVPQSSPVSGVHTLGWSIILFLIEVSLFTNLWEQFQKKLEIHYKIWNKFHMCGRPGNVPDDEEKELNLSINWWYFSFTLETTKSWRFRVFWLLHFRFIYQTKSSNRFFLTLLASARCFDFNYSKNLSNWAMERSTKKVLETSA